MNSDMWKSYARGMAAAMNGGSAVVPAGLLKAYRGVGLSDSDLLLVIQLMAFRQLEQIDFPTPEQLGDRLGVTARTAAQHIGRLVKEGHLAIDEEIDARTGIQSERYNWSALITRCAEWLADEYERRSRPERGGRRKAEETPDLFTVFEQEFGRPLSPMECETISAWIDQDEYPDELIRFALKEAVFAGKLHFRYIDRILIEWSRNRVTNTDEAKAHTQKFRGAGRSSM